MTRHFVQKYGRREVESWWFEVWNEPDIGYWHGTPEEFMKLYDYAADGVRRALPDRDDRRSGSDRTQRRAHAAVPARLHRALPARERTTRPARSARRSIWSRSTPRARRGSARRPRPHEREQPAPRDRQRLQDRRVVSGAQEHRRSSSASPIPKAAPPVRSAPIPSNAYRNGTMFSSYTAEQIARTYQLADLHKVNLLGIA